MLWCGCCCFWQRSSFKNGLQSPSILNSLLTNNGKDYCSLCPQNHLQDLNHFFLLVTVWEEYCRWSLFFSFPGVLKYGDVNQVVANPQTWSFVSQLDKVWTKWCMKHWPINFITNRSESKKLTWGDEIHISIRFFLLSLSGHNVYLGRFDSIPKKQWII
jgi:hypothetical protein